MIILIIIIIGTQDLLLQRGLFALQGGDLLLQPGVLLLLHLEVLPHLLLWGHSRTTTTTTTTNNNNNNNNNGLRTPPVGGGARLPPLCPALLTSNATNI